MKRIPTLFIGLAAAVALWYAVLFCYHFRLERQADQVVIQLLQEEIRAQHKAAKAAKESLEESMVRLVQEQYRP